MMRRLVIGLSTVFFLYSPVFASDTTRSDSEEADVENSAQESEAKGIIPEGGHTASTQAMTPIALLPERNLYDQALEELALAQALWAEGKAEAASDVALQAYDDLMGAHVSRRNKKKRRKLLADRRRAAAVYIDSSVDYIQKYVKKKGETSPAIEEGRARLADLRDVAMGYPDINRKLTKALEAYTVKPSSPTASATDLAASSPPVSVPAASSPTLRQN